MSDNHHRTATTVVKAFAILDLFVAEGKTGISLTDVSGHLDVSRSTAHRYLSTLESLGVLEKDDKDRYHLGLKLLEITGAYLTNNDLRMVSWPILDKLAAESNETAHTSVPSGSSIVYIARVAPPQSVQMVSHIGVRTPMYCTSSGKIILAHYSLKRVNKVIDQGLPQRTPTTITSRHALLEELEKARQQGFAIDDQEHEMGVRSVAAPILNVDAKVIGALSLSGPASRITKRRAAQLGNLVKDEALNLSRRIGYLPSLSSEIA